MIDRAALLADLRKLLQRLETDLLERSESAEAPQVGWTLRADHEQAKAAARTAQNYEDWRGDAITQAAAAWVLSCVFVRFLEDNQLMAPPKIAGPGQRLRQARDEWELYLAQTPQPNERDYLLNVFDALANLPGTKDVFGVHNPIRELPNWLSGDAAAALLQFFQTINAETGLLVHDFTDPDWDTRFLGDLYQDLSEAARKKYALLQTPEFVEEFILDRTLDPALDEFGLDAPPVIDRVGDVITPAGFRMIDPACGSGHFLLGGFRRILDRWQKREPAAKTRDLAQRTLDCIYGVDVNPYAVAIARFRLLLVAMRACGITRLADTPAFQVNLACGDSLLHGPGSAVQTTLGDIAEVHHAYQPEDLPLLRKYLTPGMYHAVVANPPYIVPRDRALNEAYRRRYESCHRQYSLAVPFMERIYRLAICPSEGKPRGEGAGYTGQITANSFMKREFGKKLIEEFLPQIDLTHVIDTSGAYIPGHGTPTVILFGRNRQPVASTIRTVMGIRGEPSTPDDPSRGLVWSAIIAQIDQPGSQSEFVSVSDSPRDNFHKHPWSIGGGGAAELKEQLDETATSSLADLVTEIGFLVITGEDNVLLVEHDVPKRQGLRRTRPLADGEVVRDWCCETKLVVLWPNDLHGNRLSEDVVHDHIAYLWPYRTSLKERKAFGIPVEQKGIPWWAIREVYPSKLRTPLSIVFAFVATHNHFVLDRGGKVFKQSAPVIKLPVDATEDDHLGLLGLLNSSTACFWMKQIFHDKGSTVDAHGARQTTVAFENFREFTGTGLLKFPLPSERPLTFSQGLDELAIQREQFLPACILRSSVPTRETFATARAAAEETLGRMIAGQEELDWECYQLYGLIDDDLCYGPRQAAPASSAVPTTGLRRGTRAVGRLALPPVALGQRAFEIVMARKMAVGELQTTWFERHGSTPITELPAEWPDDYRQLVERRMAFIERDPNIRLIEQPEYKRRWNTEPWESQLERALRDWLLDRLESYFDFDGRMQEMVSGEGSVVGGQAAEPRGGQAGGRARLGEPAADTHLLKAIQLVSVAKLADVARQDAEFLQVGELYKGDEAFDVQALVAGLVAAECVPLLPVLRYKASGLIKRGTWERTWDLQRREDAIDARTKLPSADPQHLSDDAARDLKQKQVGDIPVPTKYDSKDFLGGSFWRLRGKLDVPKERWVSFPHCEGSDGTLVIAWAGYDHLQLARAISAYYVDVQERLGGRDDPRLAPLLGCLVELLPWIEQWHNEPDAAFDRMRMGDYFDGFISEEARQMGKTVPEITAWEPPKKAGRRGK
ncbi:MAG TPA: BREX-2 system adenine-specific DNA-methyltransferase PglX [Pirellulales bacterium]|nr:BREX-2 system adenine-specific DNA-methyltransferase PglX [Pirellulales bacterium]